MYADLELGDFLDILSDYAHHTFTVVDFHSDEILTDDPFSSYDEVQSYTIQRVELHPNSEIRVFVRT